jgi:hypothetical protein
MKMGDTRKSDWRNGIEMGARKPASACRVVDWDIRGIEFGCLE